MKKGFKTALIILVILGVIVFAIYKVVKSRIQAVSDAGYSNLDSVISTYTVKRQDVISSIKNSGIITSFNIETLDIEVGDKITDIFVSDGQKVNANQEILKVKDNSGKERTIKSSISGMFFCIEDVTMGTKYCIYNLDDIGVKIALSEKDVKEVKIGQKAIVNITALNQNFDGSVSYISSLPQNDKFIVKLKLEYNDNIRFGYSVNTSVITSEKNNVIVIPYDYVKESKDGRYYVCKKENKSIYMEHFFEGTEIPEEYRTYIEMGTVTSKSVEVLGGIEEGDKIISEVF